MQELSESLRETVSWLCRLLLEKRLGGYSPAREADLDCMIEAAARKAWIQTHPDGCTHDDCMPDPDCQLAVGCVAPGRCNPRAHGRIALTEHCPCGAIRDVLANGTHREYGSWSNPHEDEPID